MMGCLGGSVAPISNKYYEKENLIVNGRIKEETSLKMNLNISQ